MGLSWHFLNDLLILTVIPRVLRSYVRARCNVFLQQYIQCIGYWEALECIMLSCYIDCVTLAYDYKWWG